MHGFTSALNKINELQKIYYNAAINLKGKNEHIIVNKLGKKQILRPGKRHPFYKIYLLTAYNFRLLKRSKFLEKLSKDVS